MLSHMRTTSFSTTMFNSPKPTNMKSGTPIHGTRTIG